MKMYGVLDAPFPVRDSDFGPLDLERDEPEHCSWCRDPLPEDRRRLPNDRWVCEACWEATLEEFVKGYVPEVMGGSDETICLGCGVEAAEQARPVPGGTACPECYREVLDEMACQAEFRRTRALTGVRV